MVKRDAWQCCRVAQKNRDYELFAENTLPTLPEGYR
jgi:hypothetical protein